MKILQSSDRQRFSRLDLNTNPSNDDMSAERRRQLKLSFQPESIKTIIKPQALPERTRYYPNFSFQFEFIVSKKNWKFQF